MARGDVYPPERRLSRDEATSAMIVQLTNAPANSHNPYFLNSAWVDDGRQLVVTSYRSGQPDLYAIDEVSGVIRQLTDSGDVSPWSACVGSDTRHVFFTAGSQLRVVEVTTTQVEVVADLGPDVRLGNLSRGPDGREIVTCARKAPVNLILAIATDGSGWREVFQTTELLAHAQFSPDGRSILYASNLPRLWIVDVDGWNNRVLRRQTHHEWITHESWLSDDEIIFSYWPRGLRAVRRDGSSEREIAAFTCWHPSARRGADLIVSDTTLPDVGLQLVHPQTGERRTLCYPRSSNGGYQWAMPEPAWEGSVPEDAYGPQWTHPHPSFSPDGRKIVYTSDLTGYAQVYVVEIPDNIF